MSFIIFELLYPKTEINAECFRTGLGYFKPWKLRYWGQSSSAVDLLCKHSAQVLSSEPHKDPHPNTTRNYLSAEPTIKPKHWWVCTPPRKTTFCFWDPGGAGDSTGDKTLSLQLLTQVQSQVPPMVPPSMLGAILQHQWVWPPNTKKIQILKPRT